MLTINSLNTRHLTGLCLALAGIAATMTFYAASQWQHDWKLAHVQSVAPVTDTTGNAVKLIAAIPSYHLFGHAPDDGADMPISSLQLQVNGIMQYTDANGNDASKAMISMAGQPAHFYKVGDTLTGNVIVNRITSDSVILENDGQLEKLPLARKPLAFKPRSSEGTVT